MISVVIVAAGSSRRMGFDKLLAPLKGKAVLDHTIERFLNTEEITEVIVVCPKDRFSTLSASTKSNEKVIQVEGGKERHHSVKAGLDTVSKSVSHVAIHDGARPLITAQAIRECYTMAQKTGAASLARPVTETIKRADEGNAVTESVSREDLWFMETPQMFSTALIKKAYQAVEKVDQLVTDEVSALQLLKQQTTLVNSPCFNPKITYPSDLTLAEKFLSDDH